MLVSSPVDGFRLAYVRQGSGEAVVLLHGWPGDHGDWREAAGLLGDGVAEFFSDATVQTLAGTGRFSPLEAPQRFAEAIVAARQPVTPP